MKYLTILSLAIVANFTACTAQKNVLTLGEPVCGNTGHRGIQPRDDNGNPLPMPKGNDYFVLSITASKKVTVEAVNLVAVDLSQKVVSMTPQFTEGGKSRTINAGETVYLRAEKTDKASILPNDSMKEGGRLTLRVGKKKVVYAIKKFEFIAPM
jgi:hypothetical protein